MAGFTQPLNGKPSVLVIEIEAVTTLSPEPCVLHEHQAVALVVPVLDVLASWQNLFHHTPLLVVPVLIGEWCLVALLLILWREHKTKLSEVIIDEIGVVVRSPPLQHLPSEPVGEHLQLVAVLVRGRLHPECSRRVVLTRLYQRVT